MVESKDTPSRRVSSRIAGKPDNGLSSTTSAAAKRKPMDAPAPAKKAKVVGAAAPTGNAAPSPASKVLTKGSPSPAVTLRDESGKDIDIAQLKKTVIFTYPKANTPGCTTQACLFRDEYAQFQKAGFQVYGLSSDGETSLKNWKEKKGFGYSLLSDPKRKLIAPLTGSASSTIRSHFVIDADGKLAHSAIKVKPAESSAAALEIAKGL